MLRSISLMTFSFLIGFAFVAGMSAHRIITTPLLPAVTEAQVDAGSVCVIANNVRAVPDCQAFTWTKSVSFKLDIGPAEANKLCAAIASRTSGFAGKGWTLRIYSPYYASYIASCPLR